MYLRLLKFFQKVFSRPPIYCIIFSCLSPRSLVRFRATCRVSRAAVATYFRCAFSINRHLRRFFTDPLAFRSLQARTGTVISGSSALQFLDRTFYPDSDLDIYVHPGHVHEVLHWLESAEGYSFSPNSKQPESWREVVPSEWDGTVQRLNEVGPVHAPYHAHEDCMKGVKDVFTFYKSSGNGKNGLGQQDSLKVQVIEAEANSNPIEIILNFHLTCVMNIITFDAAYAFYPIPTFEERSTIMMRNPRPQYRTALAKYMKRGWRIYASIENAGPSFFHSVPRWVNDKYTWKIPLDTTGVTQRQALSPSSQLFTWDPSIHNGWSLEHSQSMLFDRARSTLCRYNYLVPRASSKLVHALTMFFVGQGKILHPMLENGEISLDDWTWFDSDIPAFRAAHS